MIRKWWSRPQSASSPGRGQWVVSVVTCSKMVCVSCNSAVLLRVTVCDSFCSESSVLFHVRLKNTKTATLISHLPTEKQVTNFQKSNDAEVSKHIREKRKGRKISTGVISGHGERGRYLPRGGQYKFKMEKSKSKDEYKTGKHPRKRRTRGNEGSGTNIE